MENLVSNSQFEEFFEVVRRPSHATDERSFVMAGVPSISFGMASESHEMYQKLCHTQYDTPGTVSALPLDRLYKFVLNRIVALDSAELLPYDFLPTLEVPEKDIASRTTGSVGIIDISETLAKIRRIKGLALQFAALRES